MFICGRCSKPSEPHAVQTVEVAERRKKVYPAREKANLSLKKDGETFKLMHTDDPGGIGFEIVREIKVCPNCVGL